MKMIYHIQLQDDEWKDEALKKMDSIVGEKIVPFLSFVAHSESFTKFELAEAMGILPMYADRIISQFFLSNMLKRAETKGCWMVSKAGRLWCDKKLTEYKQ